MKNKRIIKCLSILMCARLAIPLSSLAGQRTFLMGTSTFTDFFQFKFENPGDKDFFAVHVDDFLGIPWTAFQNGTTLPASWVSNMQAIQADAQSSGKIIYLALGPLTDRITLAKRVEASGATTNGWAPVDASGCYLFSSDTN